jgi:hyperosmotically inducible periplasmic protein
MKSRQTFQVLMAGVLLASSALASDKPATVPRTDADIAKSVQHELLTYPYYSIFDDISFQVQNGQVALMGEVTQPFKQSDIHNIVAKAPGVEGLTDRIRVLPISDFDNRLRQQVAAAIYRYPSLSRYGMGTHPSIHIVVENGHVTLTGVVDNVADKNVAGIRASSVGMSFGPVVNNLQVATSPRT